MRRAPALLACLLAAAPAAAGTAVAPGPGLLAAAVSAAAPGESLRLMPGLHQGGVTVDRPLSLLCDPGAVIDGGGRGSVLVLIAPDVTVRGCEIRGSGDDHSAMDSGVRVLKGADRAVIEGNHVTGNLYGIDFHGPKGGYARGNLIEGRVGRRMNERGNGVYLQAAFGVHVIGNTIRRGRDGVFVNTSKGNEIRENHFSDLRFAVHYMYGHDGVVTDNVSVGNDIGYAIMFSDRVRIERNVADGPREQGVLLNYANGGSFIGNLVRGVGDRAVFIYNAHKNRIEGNRIEGSGIGVHFTAGSERNDILGNAFVANRMQVKYVGTKWVDWSAEGRGNHWSDHAAFDLNHDGFADAPYRPNDSMDRVLWTQPAARLLLGSPAVQLIRWAQKAFPATLPGGVIDMRPLMRAPDPVWASAGPTRGAAP
jgi:nitrous oxidase accessory protein